MEHPALPNPVDKLDDKRGKMVKCALLVVIALVSAVFLRAHFSSAETYRPIYETLDQRQNNVLSLAFGAALISSAISALPEDMGTALSSEYADFYTGFAFVVCALLLEKYLLTTIGFVFFAIIIPICCGLMISWYLSPQLDSSAYKRRQMASKLLVFGMTIFLMTPVSVFIGRQIDDSYRVSMEETIRNTEEVKDTLEQEKEKEEVKEEDSGPIEMIKRQFENASSAVGGAIDTVGKFATGILPWAINQLRSYAELFAVTVVTSIVIPLLVPVVAYLMFKILFLSDSDITIPAPLVEALSSAKNALPGDSKPRLGGSRGKDESKSPDATSSEGDTAAND